MKRKIDNKKVFDNGSAVANAMKDALIINALYNICNDAIRVAIDTHNFDNQTENLEESYSFGIYHKGVLTRQFTEGASKGSELATSYLESYKSSKQWECVIIAGADYASNLEGYIRQTDGERSKKGDELIVLSDSMNFVELESITYFNG